MERVNRKTKQNVIFAILSAILIALFIINFLLGIFGGYTKESPFYHHIIYPFFHANIFHLLVNIYALYYACYAPKRLIPSLAIAIIVSFITFAHYPTMGISGALYAYVGLSGLIFKVKKPTPPIIILCTWLLIGLILPKLNGLLHILCFICGCLCYYIKSIYNGNITDFRRFNR